MKLNIDNVKRQMLAGLVRRGLSKNDSTVLVESFLEAELRGKKTHGISKLFLLEEALQKRDGKPEIIKEKFNYAFIDGHKELGHITANVATDVLIRKAKKHGTAFVAVTNSYYYTMVGSYARKVAKEGFVCIVLNNGGPAAVVPYGGTTPIFGTNPIAIGIPTNEEPLVLDMATSEKSWGEINLAKVEGRPLQEKTFLDKKGTFTTIPDQVCGIEPFGGMKGAGLNELRQKSGERLTFFCKCARADAL